MTADPLPLVLGYVALVGLLALVARRARVDASPQGERGATDPL